MSQQKEDNRPPSGIEELQTRVQKLEDALGKGVPPASGLIHRVKHVYQYLIHRDGGKFFEPFHYPEWDAQPEEDFAFVPNDGRRYQLIADGLIKADARKHGLLHIYCVRSHFQVESLLSFVVDWSCHHSAKSRSLLEKAIKRFENSFVPDQTKYYCNVSSTENTSRLSFVCISRLAWVLLFGWAPSWPEKWVMQPMQPVSEKQKRAQKMFWAVVDFQKVRNIVLHPSEDKSLEERLFTDNKVSSIFDADRTQKFESYDAEFRGLVKSIRDYMQDVG